MWETNVDRITPVVYPPRLSCRATSGLSVLVGHEKNKGLGGYEFDNSLLNATAVSSKKRWTQTAIRSCVNFVVLLNWHSDQRHEAWRRRMFAAGRRWAEIKRAWSNLQHLRELEPGTPPKTTNVKVSTQHRPPRKIDTPQPPTNYPFRSPPVLVDTRCYRFLLSSSSFLSHLQRLPLRRHRPLVPHRSRFRRYRNVILLNTQFIPPS